MVESQLQQWRTRFQYAADAGHLSFLGLTTSQFTIWNVNYEEKEETRLSIPFQPDKTWLLPENTKLNEALRALLDLLESSLPWEEWADAKEQRVADSKELLLKLTDKSPGAFFQFEKRLDGTLAFPFLSKGIEDIHPGLTVEALQADPRLGFSQIHPGDLPEIMGKLSQSYRELTPWDYEFRVVQQDQTVWHRALAQPERKQDGTVVWYGSFQDINEQKNRYFALEARNEQLKEIVWLQSHVIRAPVARLMGLVEVMELGNLTEEERAMMLDAVLASAHEIDEVVKQVVDKTSNP